MKRILKIILKSVVGICALVIILLFSIAYFIFGIIEANIYGMLCPILFIILFIMILNYIDKYIEFSEEYWKSKIDLFYEIHLTKSKIKEYSLRLIGLRNYYTFCYYRDIDKKEVLSFNKNYLKEIKKIKTENIKCVYKRKEYTFSEFEKKIEKNIDIVPTKIINTFDVNLFQKFSFLYLSNQLVIEKKQFEIIEYLSDIVMFIVTIAATVKELNKSFIAMLAFIIIFVIFAFLSFISYYFVKKITCKEQVENYRKIYNELNNQEVK